MTRYAGVRDGKIAMVSDAFFMEKGKSSMIEIPQELDGISNEDLLQFYHYRNGQIELIRTSKPAKQLKVAFITNWAMACGIASYGKLLYSEIVKHIGDFKFFIEKNDDPIEPILNLTNNQTLNENQIISCWKRGENLMELAKEIRSYDPDIILINHEYGIFPILSHWLSFMTQISKYRTITTMHSIFPHHIDKMAYNAAIKEIVVHLEGAKEVLKKQGIETTYLIPHGCLHTENKPRLWNMYRSEHTFMSSGFLFPYKKIENSIKATYLLKSKYPNIFFTGLLSESSFNKIDHQFYYDRLMTLISELKIEENVGFIRGYQSEEVIDAFYRMNKIAVFPYGSDPEHLVYGASGAARIAMSKGIPVITSNIPHFSDLPTIKADTPEDIAKELDQLFSDPKNYKEQINRQNSYLEENSWEKMAQKYLYILENPPNKTA
jgi:glycosyltransferase involved in cell wall biosynthesis